MQIKLSFMWLSVYFQNGYHCVALIAFMREYISIKLILNEINLSAVEMPII